MRRRCTDRLGLGLGDSLLPTLPTSVAVDAVELRFPGVDGQLASALSVSDEREAFGASSRGCSCWLAEGPPLVPVRPLRNQQL